ncbi:hypothetical protein GYMLUDRAFT_250221 [Collybiopsis luxurians FD-317 M1]|uniref:Uncharacterized protein n=1 Tax=Collybiopsis luxurians FD-317 M1 TaxID=944289 RepID=A0A0D0BVF1_9AGAR|nr:hypothetical protein GYMLUDRAFT_250221 [Collybiopsis luxurians FD-317 M1]
MAQDWGRTILYAPQTGKSDELEGRRMDVKGREEWKPEILEHLQGFMALEKGKGEVREEYCIADSPRAVKGVVGRQDFTPIRNIPAFWAVTNPFRTKEELVEVPNPSNVGPRAQKHLQNANVQVTTEIRAPTVSVAVPQAVNMYPPPLLPRASRPATAFAAPPAIPVTGPVVAPLAGLPDYNDGRTPVVAVGTNIAGNRTVPSGNIHNVVYVPQQSYVPYGTGVGAAGGSPPGPPPPPPLRRYMYAPFHHSGSHTSNTLARLQGGRGYGHQRQ